jgi:hypothetical protein
MRIVEQHIEFVSRDHYGITAIVTPTGVIDAQTAIEHIRSGRVRFVAGPTSWDRTEVTAREAYNGVYLYANWDGTRRNNLLELAGAQPDSREFGHSLPRRVRIPAGALRLLARAIAVLGGRSKRAKRG